jgi:NADPH2:quinone reductase
MRAFRIETHGQPPRLADIDRPEPGPGEVLLRIAACGLNFADLLMIEGRYQERLAPPFTLGMEAAGTVEALGPGVVPGLTGPAPGARVAVFAAQGGLAEWGVFPAAHCLTIPDAMSFEAAAAFQVAYGTSHVALVHRARLAPGETLLVTGAAGGVGLTAVEIGRLLGARVVASARGADRLAVARAAGAEILIDSETADLKAELRALGGVDVVYDTIGGETFAAALRATRPEGRLIPIGFAGGDVPQVPANLLLVKNLTVIGCYWGGYRTFRPEVLTDSLAALLEWFADGRIAPHASHVLPLAETETALDLLRRRAATGKVVVRC